MDFKIGFIGVKPLFVIVDDFLRRFKIAASGDFVCVPDMGFKVGFLCDGKTAEIAEDDEFIHSDFLSCFNRRTSA